MKSFWRPLVGVMLIVLGIAAILQTFGVIEGSFWAVFFSAFFVLGGIGFIVYLVPDRSNWWAAIPGVILIGLGGTIAMAEYLPDPFDELSGAWFLLSIGIAFLLVYAIKRDHWWPLIPGLVMTGLSVMAGLPVIVPALNDEVATGIFLASIGLAFLFVYLLKRDQWWAIIPAGSMFSVAALVAIEEVSYLFLGLAITFAVLALLRLDGRKMTWPWIPAGILFVMGVIFFISESAASVVSAYFWPAVLILLGAAMIIRAFRRRS